MSRSDELTTIVTDWARADPVHGPRLQRTARQGADVLERAVYHLLRSGGGPAGDASTVKELRRQMSPADMELTDWPAVARLLRTP